MIIEEGIVKFRDAVTVLGIFPGDEILLVQQFRKGVGKETFELPGGIIEQGETILEAGIREFYEETGCVLDSPKFLLTLEMEGVVSTHKISLLAGKVSFDSIPKPEKEAKLLRLKLETIGNMIYNGDIQHGPTVCLFFIAKSGQLWES